MPLYDYGEADGWFFLVLEYVPGGTLKQRLAEPLPPRVAAGLMETIARAVGYIHGRGLLHLDLKPSNILLDCEENGPWDRVTPRISDFGLALSNDDAGASETSLAGIRGTPSYMAPEQASRVPRRRRGGGRHPCPGRHPVRVADRPPAVPGNFDAGNARSSPRPESRAPTATESEDPPRPGNHRSQVPGEEPLPALRLGRGTGRRPAPLARRPADQGATGFPDRARWRWCRRRPAVAALATTLMMTISVGFLAVVLFWRHCEVEHQKTEQERNHAERERSRAEAAAGRAIALAEVLTWALREIQVTGLSRDQFIVSLQTARRRILDLAEPRSNDLEISKLAYVDLGLGRGFDVQGKIDEARLLHAESLSYWEKSVQADPSDGFARRRRFDSAFRLARIVEQHGNAEKRGRAPLGTSGPFGEGMLPAISDGELATIAECHCSIARHVARLGDHVGDRTILEGTLRTLGNVPAMTISPAVQASVARTRSELGQITHRFSLPEIDHLTVKDWTDRVVGFLSSIAGNDSTGMIKESEVGYWLTQSLLQGAASQRRNAKLDDAHRTVDRIQALGNIMVARYPDQAGAGAYTWEKRSRSGPRTRDSMTAAPLSRMEAGPRRGAQGPAARSRDARAERLVTVLQRRLDDLLARPREKDPRSLCSVGLDDWIMGAVLGAGRPTL